MWNALAVGAKPRQPTLFDDLEPDEPHTSLPAISPEEEVRTDYRLMGLSLRSHPLAFHRKRLEPLGGMPTAALARIADGAPVRVAGIVLLRQRPDTSKGVTFATIEDETGIANLVISMGAWERFRKVARHSQAWIVHGQLQNQSNVIHVVVRRIEDLAHRLPPLVLKSRDFR